MRQNNPYAISFGHIPRQYISRELLIDDISDLLNKEQPDEQAFKLTGIRGTGKTVTLTAIEKRLRDDENWIVVDLKSNGNITEDLVANLYSEVPFITKYVDASLNLSAFGIGINISEKSPIASLDVALKKIMAKVRDRKKRVLIAIDEVRKTDGLVDFIQEFQILIRQEYLIFLIVAGLYEDIESVENTDGLTFFLRAEKYDMKPLNLGVIREDYKKTLNLSDKTAETLAKMTKGYAFAYQAFGKFMWESGEKEITGMVLAQVDEALSEKVYDKIWSELSNKDRRYLSYIVQKDRMTVEELLQKTGTKHNEWSVPRKKLIEKGIIEGKIRGEISVRLPRFKEYIDTLIE